MELFAANVGDINVVDVTVPDFIVSVIPNPEYEDGRYEVAGDFDLLQSERGNERLRKKRYGTLRRR